MKVLRTLPVDDAIRLYQHLYERGRHGHAPGRGSYEWMTERGAEWVVAKIPIANLVFQTPEDSGPERLARARQYASTTGTFPPGVASYHGRGRKRQSGRAWVQDGNHRVLAATMRGDDRVTMLMPAEEFRALREDASARTLRDRRRRSRR